LIRNDAVQLSRAPERFLGEAWARLVELKGDEDQALKALDHPEASFLAHYRREALKSNPSPERRKESQDAEEVAELTGKMFTKLHELGAKGRIVASGLYAGTGQRQTIPAELWPSAKLSFVAQSVSSGDFAYRNVTVALGVIDVEDATARMRAWLKKRREEQGEEPKKSLQGAAQKKFVEAFTVRAFNKAYGAVYGRAHGRPRKRN